MHHLLVKGWNNRNEVVCVMRVHLLLKKEEIDETEMGQGKIAVVFDILLATSTITVALHNCAKEVIPVVNSEVAIEVSKQYKKGEFILVGEYEGKAIEGFLDPSPLRLLKEFKDKTVILSTTNGTVAIQNSKLASKVYACSLLNGQRVAEAVSKDHNDETIILICSGSSGHFSLEDFYGAGYFLNCLEKLTNLELTDSSKAALLFFKSYCNQSIRTLMTSKVGEMLESYGYKEEVEFVSQMDIISVVPVLRGNAMIRS